MFPLRKTQQINLLGVLLLLLWWQGPDFLLQHPDLWRPQPDCVPTSDALKELVTLDRVVGRYSFSDQVVYTPPPVLDLVLDGVNCLDSVAPGNLMLRVRALEQIQQKLGKKISYQPLLPILLIHDQRTELGELVHKVQNSQPLPKTFRKFNLFIQE